MSGFRALKDRKIVQWALAYAAGAWLVMQLVEVLGDRWGWPLGLQRGTDVILILGFLVTVVLAWYHGEQGRQRVSAAELTIVTLLLAVAGGVLAILNSGREASPSQAAAGDILRDKPAIAVLPFENISPEASDAYFADGMHEEIISTLSKITRLTVISRTSVEQYREAPKSMRAIGAELGVGFILEGSARRDEDRVRLTVQLIDAASDEHLWTENYDRDLSAGSLFDIQSDLAGRIAAALKVRVAPEERDRIDRRPTDDLSAYETYLLGRTQFSTLSSKGLLESIDTFDGVIARDSGYAPAYAGLADAYLLFGYLGFPEGPLPQEAMEQARGYAATAVALDPDLSEAHAALGAVAWRVDLDREEAERRFRLGLQLNPSNVRLRSEYATLLSALGRQQESIEQMREARRLDPLSASRVAGIAWALGMDRQFNEAIELARQAIAMDGSSSEAHTTLGWGLVGLERYDDAIEALESALRVSGRNRIVLGSLAYVYAKAGDETAARALIRELETGYFEGRVSPYYLAWAHAGFDDADQVLDWLEKAYEERWGNMNFLEVNMIWDPVREDPRFQALLRQVGLDQ